MKQNTIVKGTVVRVVIAVKATHEVLLVKSADRPSVWELPGCKTEEDEETLTTALRELAEETGLSGIALTPKCAWDKTIREDPLTVWRHSIFVGICLVRPEIIIDNKVIIDYRL